MQNGAVCAQFLIECTRHILAMCAQSWVSFDEVRYRPSKRSVLVLVQLYLLHARAADLPQNAIVLYPDFQHVIARIRHAVPLIRSYFLFRFRYYKHKSLDDKSSPPKLPHFRPFGFCMA